MKPVSEGVLPVLPGPLEVRRQPSSEEVATQFEALLLRNMVEAMRRSVGADEEQEGGQLVDHLIEDALATHLAKAGGIGLADFLDAEVDQPQRTLPTDTQLHLRRWLHDGLQGKPE